MKIKLAQPRAIQIFSNNSLSVDNSFVHDPAHNSGPLTYYIIFGQQSEVGRSLKMLYHSCRNVDSFQLCMDANSMSVGTVSSSSSSKEKQQGIPKRPIRSLFCKELTTALLKLGQLSINLSEPAKMDEKQTGERNYKQDVFLAKKKKFFLLPFYSIHLLTLQFFLKPALLRNHFLL